MQAKRARPSIAKRIKKVAKAVSNAPNKAVTTVSSAAAIVTKGVNPPKPLANHRTRSSIPGDGNPQKSQSTSSTSTVPPDMSKKKPEVGPESQTPEEVEREIHEEKKESKKDDEKKISKPIEEMTEKEFEETFHAKGEPTYDQKRVLLGQVPIPSPGKPLATFIDLDNIPPFAEPPSGLVYKDVRFDAAPKGIQEQYRSWISEFRKGMADPKGQSTLNILLQGPPGTGKTESIRFLAQDTRLPFWNIQGENLDPMSLFGAWTKDRNGKVVFEEGTLVQAVRHGGILLLDELNAFPQDVQIRLNSLLDDRRTLYLRETGEVIRANPELIIFATQNPPGEGTHDLIPQLKSRFQKRLWMPLPPESEQVEIVKARLRLSNERFAKIEPTVQKSLKLIKNLNNMELSYQPTLREAVVFGRDMAAGNDTKSSLTSDFLDIYYDPDERKAVAETINSVFPSMYIKA